MKTVVCDKCGQTCKNNNYYSLGNDVELCLPCYKIRDHIREKAAEDWLKDKNPRMFYNPEIDR